MRVGLSEQKQTKHQGNKGLHSNCDTFCMIKTNSSSVKLGKLGSSYTASQATVGLGTLSRR